MDEYMMLRYLRGECSADEEASFQEWLYQSDENRKQFYEVKALWNYRHEDHFHSKEQLNKASAALGHRIDQAESLRKKQVYIRFARYAASVILALAIPLVLWTTYKHIYTSGLVTIAVAQTDSSRLVTLQDGSRVWLNSNSSITYPEHFSKEERTVSFSGEAYFEVAHDSLHPFIVQTNSVHVKVLGTSFNVRAYPSEQRTETTLLQGKVIVQNKNGTDLAVLAPGQMAAFDRVNQYLSVKEVDADQYAAWRHGVIVFTNATLADITQELSTLYQVRFVMNDPPDPALYNFNFRKSQPIEKVMEMLCFVAPLRYHREGNEIIVGRR